MSDTWSGPGWWMAEDGLWYPPRVGGAASAKVERSDLDDGETNELDPDDVEQDRWTRPPVGEELTSRTQRRIVLAARGEEVDLTDDEPEVIDLRSNRYSQARERAESVPAMATETRLAAPPVPHEPSTPVDEPSAVDTDDMAPGAAVAPASAPTGLGLTDRTDGDDSGGADDPPEDTAVTAVDEQPPVDAPETSRGVWLLTTAALLAIIAGVLGGLWLRERGTTSDLREQLDVTGTAPVVTQTDTTEVERLEDLVRTLELQNADLEEELEALRPLVADVPAGRISELGVPFNPVFVDESSGRFIAVGDDGAYVVIDGSDGTILDSGQVDAAPVGLVALRDVAWVATESGLFEIVSMIGAEESVSLIVGETRALTRNDRAMWAWSVDTGELRRHRITNGRVTANVALPSPPIELAGGAGAIWALGEDGLVYQVNTADFTVTTIEAGQDVVAITAGPDALWALSAADGSLRRVDPVSGQVLVTVPVGRDPIDAVVSGNSVWVALRSGSTTLIEVDTRTSAVVSRTALPDTPESITDGESGVIVTLVGDDNPLIRVASVDPALDDSAAEDAG